MTSQWNYGSNITDYNQAQMVKYHFTCSNLVNFVAFVVVFLLELLLLLLMLFFPRINRTRLKATEENRTSNVVVYFLGKYIPANVRIR